jgi:hypothetical protein
MNNNMNYNPINNSPTVLEYTRGGALCVFCVLFVYQFAVFHANRSLYENPRDGLKLFGIWDW